jgi:hypothetical protein
MAVISFPFNSALANRIANLITGDIQKLERECYGTVTNWQSKYERPFKAHYANDLFARADTPDKLNALNTNLPKYEKRAADYTNDRNKRGRPLTTFINRTDPATDAVDTDAADTDDNELSDEIAALLSDDIPVPGKRAAQKPESVKPTAQKPEPAKPTAQKPDGMTPEAFAAMQALMAALAPQAAPIDEAAIRAIARDEANKAVKPTVVHVARTDETGTEVTVNLGVQHKQFPALLKLCGLRDHNGYAFPVWLPGPAGSGKTTAAMNAAQAMELPFHHTGAVDNVYGLLGFIDAGGTYHRTAFREAYEHGGVFLFDEVDASVPAAMVALNAALENGHCAFPDGTIQRHKDCIVIAAANTYGAGATHEYVGRNKLDAATVDRFIMLDWQYDEILERAIAGDNEWTTYVQKVRNAVKSAGIKHVISPRASIRGNAMLAAGFDRDMVIEGVVKKGLSADQWSTIKARMY